MHAWNIIADLIRTLSPCRQRRHCLAWLSAAEHEVSSRSAYQLIGQRARPELQRIADFYARTDPQSEGGNESRNMNLNSAVQ